MIGMVSAVSESFPWISSSVNGVYKYLSVFVYVAPTTWLTYHNLDYTENVGTIHGDISLYHFIIISVCNTAKSITETGDNVELPHDHTIKKRGDNFTQRMHNAKKYTSTHETVPTLALPVKRVHLFCLPPQKQPCEGHQACCRFPIFINICKWWWLTKSYGALSLWLVLRHQQAEGTHGQLKEGADG
jgi:hypothetical protein